ncbi:MAG: DUF4430 domain-containing protein [Lachnospiraceae bacterium]|nr:DUF4430 domain-containing protein [Lachnospiraceae bacterium]
MVKEKRKMKTEKKKLAILAAVFVVAIAVLGVVFFALKPGTEDGVKKYTLEIILADGTSTTHELKTEEEYLGQALLNEGLITGESGEYGLFITAVNGITANSDNQEWWCLTVNYEEWMYGIDQTPVTDGGHYELTLKVGW